MVQVRPVTFSDKKKTSTGMLASLNYLFYVSKFFGIIPYSLTDYITKKQFKLSLIGSVWCLISCIHFTAHHYIITSEKMIYRDSEQSISMLTIVIGLMIVYLEPLMMIIDCIAALVNQKSLIEVFDRLKELDEKLMKDDIAINFKIIVKSCIILLGINFVGEIALCMLNLAVFGDDIYSLHSLWFLTTAFPLCVNSIARTWFVVLILLIQQRLRAINRYLEEAKNIFHERRLKRVNNPNYVDLKKDNIFIENVGFMEKEIFTTKNLTFKNAVVGNFHNNGNWVEQSSKGNFGDIPQKPNKVKVKFVNVMPNDANKVFDKKSIAYNNNSINSSHHDSIIGDKMDKKLINLCRAHDEICDVAKQVNRMFSFQMLITMAYGFLTITAHFYFLYCGIVHQPIPIFFRTAESIEFTIVFIIYTTYKCVCVIYISWKTKIDSQKTGIQMHKIANVVDENHFYNVCNHLSLKLLNNHLNFTACGFFGLEMSTIYAISGAITSYLIILIQFNLAAMRAKPTSTATSNTNDTMQLLNISAATILPPIMNTARP